MRDPLVLAVAQPLSVSHDVAANALAHAAMVRAAGARVVVFPELSLTGYELKAAAILPTDPRLEPIVLACAETGSLALVGAPLSSVTLATPPLGEAAGAALSGSVVGAGPSRHVAGPLPSGEAAGAALSGGALEGDHIGVLAVDGGGVRVAYRKMWVGDTESARFSPGDAPAVVEVDGWRLGLAVCKDVSVAQHQADTVALGIDAYVAGTAKFAYEAQTQTERAARLAAQHRMWVAIASFAGPTGDGYDETAGCSGIWSPEGKNVAQAGPEIGAFARATLS